MFATESKRKLDYRILIPTLLLLVIGLFIQLSLSYITSTYFLFVALGVFFFFLFANIDFEFFSAFSKHFYIASILLLLTPIFIGQATRGTIRWIPIGDLTLQPAELVRPFLFLFFAKYLNSGKSDLPRIVKGALIFAVPTFLILIQPSLGVTLLTAMGFVGVFVVSGFPLKYYITALVSFLLLIPLGWNLLADYQKQRLFAFTEPSADPLGTGYNSIQAMISVGSGRLLGSGLGRGVQTQLQFLPERQSDFIFASLAEELGFIGVVVVLLITFYLLYRLVKVAENTKSNIARAYTVGLFLSLFAQIMIHVGMNVGLLPITGVPYPLLSAGGSSLITTLIALGIVSSVSSEV